MPIQVGSTAKELVAEVTVTFASVNANTTADQTVTTGTNLGGLTLIYGAPVYLELPNLQAGLTFCNAHVDSSGRLVVRFTNTTGGGLTPTGTSAKIVQV